MCVSMIRRASHPVSRRKEPFPMRRTLFVGLTWLLLCAPGFAQTLGHHHRRSERFHRRRGSRRHGDRGEQGHQRHPYDASNAVGLYDFPALPPGPYTVKSELEGFKTVTRDLELQVQQTARVNFTLELGTISEMATVTGVSPLVETSNATIGTVIENRRIVELPLNGRNYLQLVALEPERQRRLRRAGSGGRPPGRHARQPAAVDFGAAPRIQQLHAGRRRQHRRQLQHLYLPAVGRRARRIQGADRRLLRRIRARGEPGERGHEIGLEQPARHACSNSTATMRWTPDRTPSLPRRPPPRRRRSNGISTATPPAARSGRTTCSSCRISKATGIGNSSRLPTACRPRRCGAATSRNCWPASAPINPQTGQPTGVIVDPTQCTVVGTTRTCAPFAGNIIPAEPPRRHLQAAARVLSGAEQRHRRPQHQQLPLAAESRHRQEPVHAADGLVQSSASSWMGRYSYGNENELTPALKLNGTKLNTKVHQVALGNTWTRVVDRRQRIPVRLQLLLQHVRTRAGVRARRRSRS